MENDLKEILEGDMAFDLKEILSGLAPIFARKDVPKLLPGLYSRGYWQNLSSSKAGPPEVVIGKRVFFEKKSFINWLESRVVRKNKVAGRV